MEFIRAKAARASSSGPYRTASHSHVATEDSVRSPSQIGRSVPRADLSNADWLECAWKVSISLHFLSCGQISRASEFLVK